jgi:leucyl/phenylalanyl-tRNA--protein transferase
MAILRFPSVENADPTGLLALGGDLEVPSLKLAYENGIFPWPTEEMPLLWFSPPLRAILEFNDLKVPKRMERELKKKEFTFKIDHNFSEVIQKCSEGKTRKSSGTWITQEMIEAYTAFHRAGYAHSFECYGKNGKLVGGMYGVGLGGYFAGESMFYLESGASKAALLFAVQTLKARRATWMDVQMLTPLLELLGGKEISRKEFIQKLRKALKQKPFIF